MPQVINTNIPSLNAQRNLDTSTGALGLSLQRLSSGLRINSAKDDAAGLAIATRFTSRIQGLAVAQRNANDAISLAQVSEGALQESTNILQRARELALQSANGTNSAADRKALQSEVNQLKQELQRVASTSSFNGLNILDGSLTNTEFQIGSEANQTVAVSIADTRTSAIGSNTLKTTNTAGIEQATHSLFLGGGTSTDSNSVGTDVGAPNLGFTDTDAFALVSDNYTFNNSSFAATTFTLSNTTSNGASNTTTYSSSANVSAASIATTLAADAGVISASAFNSITLSSVALASQTDNTDSASAAIRLYVGASTDNSVIIADSDANSTMDQIATYINTSTDTAAAAMRNSDNKAYAVSTGTDVTIYSMTGQNISFNLAGVEATTDSIASMSSDTAITVTNGFGGSATTYRQLDNGGAGVTTDWVAGHVNLYNRLFDSTAAAVVEAATTDAVTDYANTDAANSDAFVGFGGRVDLELAANYTIQANNTSVFGGTASTNLTTVQVGIQDLASDGSSATNLNNNVAAQTITLSGSTGSTTVSINTGEEASALVTKINAVSGTTNISASAITTLNLESLSADGTVTFNLYGDNISTAPAAISAAVTTTDLSALVKAINDQSGATGITAAIDGDNSKIKLTHPTGNDIEIENFQHTSAIDFADPTVAAVATNGSGQTTPVAVSLSVIGNSGENSGLTVQLYDGGAFNGKDSTIVGGQITFSSSAAFSVASDVAGQSLSGSGPNYAGSLFNGGASAGNASTSNTVNGVDISTVAGAQDAIDVLDQAINQVSEIRADLGAVQSRFESAVRNIANNVENLNIARSRILDTDFAAETANLTKNQILAQAGYSILSQANSLPQNILSLLQ